MKTLLDIIRKNVIVFWYAIIAMPTWCIVELIFDKGFDVRNTIRIAWSMSRYLLFYEVDACLKLIDAFENDDYDFVGKKLEELCK